MLPALCDSVAKKLIEDGKAFLQMVVQAMGKSNPHDVRIEGFRLAQCLLVRVHYFLFSMINIGKYIALYLTKISFICSEIPRELFKSGGFVW